MTAPESQEKESLLAPGVNYNFITWLLLLGLPALLLFLILQEEQDPLHARPMSIIAPVSTFLR